MSFDRFLKGWVGEALGSLSQALFLDSSDYKTINNLTLPDGNATTQIDHVIVSRFGIFVVEDKTIDGWVFGNSKDPYWTIVNWARKYKIQNPLHQNFKHIDAVVGVLGVDLSVVHSVVVFRGNCEFKTASPANVLTHGYADYIKNFRTAVFSAEDTASMFEKLKSKAKPKNFKTDQGHIGSLRARFASTTVCPKCGGKLVLRTAKSGPTPGGEFYGCSNYPKCRYTKKVE